MFSRFCRCCFNKNDILLSMTTKSSHMDGKTLLDYFNFAMGAYIKEHVGSEFICIRCSKALQVTYHFIHMVKESQRNKTIVVEGNKELTFFNNPIQDELQQSSGEKEQTTNFEQQSKLKTNRTASAPNKLVSLKFPSSLDMFKNDSKTDAESLEILKEYKTEFECIICKKYFEDNPSLIEHNRQKHKEIVPFKCILCNFYTCYTESLFKHCDIYHGLTKVDLDLFQTKQVSKVNDIYPAFEITYLCTQCNFKSISQTVIDDHLLNTHFIDNETDSFIKETFGCPSCHRSFMNYKAAKIHYSMYHISQHKRNNPCNNRKFNCEKCGKLFDSKSGLFLHRRICERLDAVQCNFCKLQFTSVLKYERHLQDQHSVDVKHECEVCGKTFHCSEYLAVHRKRHNERYHQCDLCPKNYINNADLKVHKQRIHANKHVATTCGICGKKFRNFKDLKNHGNKIHPKRIIKCKICNFVTESNYALKIHHYNHTGKPYKCQLCFKEFVIRKDLRQHCWTRHSITLTNEEIAEMFKQTFGYTSRFDAFSKQNNNLEITEINDLKLEGELEEFGLTLEDIMKDLFDNEVEYNKQS